MGNHNCKIGKSYNSEEKVFVTSRSGKSPKRFISYQMCIPLFDKSTGEFAGYDYELDPKKYDLISKKLVEAEHDMMIKEINFKNKTNKFLGFLRN